MRTYFIFITFVSFAFADDNVPNLYKPTPDVSGTYRIKQITCTNFETKQKRESDFITTYTNPTIIYKKVAETLVGDHYQRSIYTYKVTTTHKFDDEKAKKFGKVWEQVSKETIEPAWGSDYLISKSEIISVDGKTYKNPHSDGSESVALKYVNESELVYRAVATEYSSGCFTGELVEFYLEKQK